MTTDKLLGLIKAGETYDVEFKGEERKPFNDSELIEAVVCMANRKSNKPGIIIIGVEDDGRITGARARHGKRTDVMKLQSLIANRTCPPTAVQVNLVSIEMMEVLCVEVKSSAQPVSTSEGRFIRRSQGGDGKPACLPYLFHEMRSDQTSRGLLDVSKTVVEGVKWNDLDPLEFERYRRAVRSSSGRSDSSLLALSDLELAKALHAVEAGRKIKGVRVLGLLLFGREDIISEALPMHEVAFQMLEGTNVRMNEFFRGPLIKIMEEIETRFRANNKEEEIRTGLLSVRIPDYPALAFREAVANAFVHRDYCRMGAVYIQWHEGRLEISNPGGFPEGVRLDNILVTAPCPRNPLLADAFKRAGLVERTGRGIDTIFYEQLRNGRPAPDYSRSDDHGVVLILPGGKASLDFLSLVIDEERAGRLLSLDDLLILNQLWYERNTTARQTANVIQKAETDARARLERLVESGLIEPRGQSRGRSYHLSGKVYKRLGSDVEYVRQIGFEPLQNEQMVLQYAEKYGSISRKTVVQLCRLDSNQAKRLLGSLVYKGKLVKHGKTRGAHYTVAQS